MLRNIRLSQKMVIMAALSAIGIAAVAYVGLSSLRSSLLADRKEKLQQLVILAEQALEQDYRASHDAGLSEDEAKKRSKSLLGGLHFGKNDYFFALDMNVVMVAHPNPDLINKSMMDAKDADGVYFAREQVAVVKEGRASGFVTYKFPRAGKDEPLPKIAYVTAFKPYNWALGSGVYLDDIDEIFWSQVRRIGAMIAVTLVVIVGMSVSLGRSIVKPITGLTAAMARLAKGDVETDVPATERLDEVGGMAKSVQIFKNAMIETIRLRHEQDDMRLQAEADKKALMAKMASDFEHNVSTSLDALSRSASGMRSMSQGMSETARGACERTMVVSVAAEEASGNVQAVASATEELSASIAEISAQVIRSNQVAGHAVDEARATNETVQGLASAAAKIGNVVQLISDIAAQTNLLALNATIEAARAGEAGKGFAVVAGEVKSLASQTARATEEISSQVAAMQTATDQAVRAIDGIGKTIAAISEISTVVAAAVEEQDAATREIARNVSRAAEGVDQVSSNIEGVKSAADETGEVAGNVRGAAEDLNHQSEALHTNVERFLAEVRSV